MKWPRGWQLGPALLAAGYAELAFVLGLRTPKPQAVVAGAKTQVSRV